MKMFTLKMITHAYDDIYEILLENSSINELIIQNFN